MKPSLLQILGPLVCLVLLAPVVDARAQAGGASAMSPAAAAAGAGSSSAQSAGDGVTAAPAAQAAAPGAPSSPGAAAAIERVQSMSSDEIRAVPTDVIRNVSPEVLRTYASPENLSKLSPEQQGAVNDALANKGGEEAQKQAAEAQKNQSCVGDACGHTNACPPGQRCDSAGGAGVGLRRFGSDLFINPPSTFAPSNFIPVPVDYVMGPGDTVAVQLFGNQNTHFELTVQRDGYLQFPSLGPIQVAGLRFDEMRQLLLDRIAKQMIGTEASITLGTLRSIQVFVVGDVKRPGAYTISSLSRMLNALFISGGIAETGSYRRIELKRDGQIAGQLDLYDLLLKGDSSKDLVLQPGDVLFVPPVGRSVTVAGSVLRPAIYELKGGERLSDVLGYAGGVTSEALLPLTKVERIGRNDRHIILDADPRKPEGNLPLQDGDLVSVFRVLNRLDEMVTVKGFVNHPLAFQWKPDLHISDLIPSSKSLPPLADLKFGLLVRYADKSRHILVYRIRPESVFAHPNGPDDMLLEPGDEVQFFGYDKGRPRQIANLVDTLSTESRASPTSPLVSIEGAAQEPGVYPLLQDMTLQDVIDAAISLNKDAWLDAALVARRDFQHNTIHVYQVSLKPTDSDLREFKMAPGDSLRVFAAADDRKAVLKDLLAILKRQATPDQPAAIFSIGGEVKFPGEYPLVQGSTVTQAILLAGGFSEPAYPYDYEVTRQEVDANGRFAMRVYTLNARAGEADHAEPPSASTGSRRIIEVDGKFMIQTPGAAAPNVNEIREAPTVPLLADAFALRAHDSLVVRRQPGYEETENVTVVGEVRFPGTYRARRGEKLSDVLRRAGGMTDLAAPEAAIFTREELRQQEEQRFREIQEDVQREATRLSIVKVTGVGAAPGPSDASQLALLSSLSDKLATVHGVGRLVIDLKRIASADSEADVQVQNGDVLRVPRARQEVTVLGEVNYPTALRFKSGRSTKEYINQSGGFTQAADSSRVYVIRANGEVTGRAVHWIGSSDIQSGDTIVVPVDLEPILPLPLTTSIATILGQLAIAAASLKVVGGF